MTNEIQESPAEEQGFSPILYTFANHSPAPELESLLAMFYKAALDNTVGVMQAFNSDKNREELLLVGVAVDDEGKTQCFPLAKVLSTEDSFHYRAPDGKGGFFDPTNEAEVKAVKESMKPVDESLVDIPVE